MVVADKPRMGLLDRIIKQKYKYTLKIVNTYCFSTAKHGYAKVPHHYAIPSSHFPSYKRKHVYLCDLK
jgi:hypothetical protein